MGVSRFALIGFSTARSVGGRVGKRSRPPNRGVAAVCPGILAGDALHEPANRLYEYDLLQLFRRMRRKAKHFPGIDASRSRGGLRQFDDRGTTAYYCGFTGPTTTTPCRRPPT